MQLAQMMAMALVPARTPGMQQVVSLPRLANLAQKLVLSQMVQPGIFRQVERVASPLRVLALFLWAQPLLRLFHRAARRADRPAGQRQIPVPVIQTFRGLAANWANCQFHASVHPDQTNYAWVHPMKRAKWMYPFQG